MIDTRRPALTEDQMRELAREVRRQGGQVIQQDGKSSVQQWVNSSIGTIAIAVAGWGVLEINKLNVNLSRVATQYEYLRDDVRDLKTEFRNHINETVRVPPNIREKR